jgi:hypothetical protein
MESTYLKFDAQKILLLRPIGTPSMALARRLILSETVQSTLCRSAPSLLLQTREKHYSRDIPANTPRHELDDGSLFIHRIMPAGTNADGSETSLPPALVGRWEKKFPHDTRLAREQVQEMKDLRQSDPDTWTVMALAKKFQVPPTVVMQLAGLHPLSERRVKVQQEEDDRFSRLRLTKKVTIVDRIRRKAKW